MYVRPHRREFALGLLALFGVDALNVLPPLLLKNFIDRVTSGTRHFSPFLILGLIYLVIALGQGVCRYLWRMFLIASSHRVAEQLRDDYFAKLQRLPPSFYDRHPIGDLMAMATNDVEAVRFAIGPGLLVFADAIFLLTSIPPAMIWLSPKLTGLALAPMLLLPFVIIYAERLVHDRFNQVQEQFSHLSGFAQENIEGIKIVKAFVREWTQLGRFDALGKDFVKLNVRLAAAQSVFEPLFLLTVSLGLVSLFIFGGREVIAGVIGLGTFVAFLRYLDNLAWPMMAFGMAVTQYQRGKTSLARLHEVFSEREEPAARPAQSDSAIRPASALLEARGLTFRYPGKNEPALLNVNFRIEKGTRTAIVGPIGSGKSTLVRLLAGLFEVEPGMLFWNGVDVTTLPLAERRACLAVVPQDAFLFSETLSWNVNMGETAADATPFLERAGLREETAAWGLDTMIGERGLNLSGGQRARVTLARALARQAPLMVLDDALSSVDAETEARILDSLSDLRHDDHGNHDQALLMITHRFARLHSFDQVLVLKDGLLVQHGAPTAIAAKPGLYRTLLELQQMENALGV